MRAGRLNQGTSNRTEQPFARLCHAATNLAAPGDGGLGCEAPFAKALKARWVGNFSGERYVSMNEGRSSKPTTRQMVTWSPILNWWHSAFAARLQPGRN